MRPLLSRTMRRSLTSVQVPPSAMGRVHSAASIEVNGAPGLGRDKDALHRP